MIKHYRLKINLLFSKACQVIIREKKILTQLSSKLVTEQTHAAMSKQTLKAAYVCVQACIINQQRSNRTNADCSE